jgi:hypothetical protein
MKFCREKYQNIVYRNYWNTIVKRTSSAVSILQSFIGAIYKLPNPIFGLFLSPPRRTLLISGRYRKLTSISEWSSPNCYTIKRMCRAVQRISQTEPNQKIIGSIFAKWLGSERHWNEKGVAQNNERTNNPNVDCENFRRYCPIELEQIIKPGIGDVHFTHTVNYGRIQGLSFGWRAMLTNSFTESLNIYTKFHLLFVEQKNRTRIYCWSTFSTENWTFA